MQGALMSNHCLISHRGYYVEEFSVPLAVVITRHSITFCVKDRKEKSGWIYCGKFRSLLSKLMFTHSAEQFRIYYFRKWGNFKAVFLSFHWFNDSWIWTRNSQIWTCKSRIWTPNSWIWTCTFEFQLVL